MMSNKLLTFMMKCSFKCERISQKMSAKLQCRPYKPQDALSDSDASLTELSKSEETGLKPTDLAWAAGLLDGEGCFHIHNQSPVVKCVMTSKKPIRDLYEIFGGKCAAAKERSGPFNRPVFRWTIYGREAAAFCAVIKDFLREKREQAHLLSIYRRYPLRSAARKSIEKRLKSLKRTP